MTYYDSPKFNETLKVTLKIVSFAVMLLYLLNLLGIIELGNSNLDEFQETIQIK